MKLLYCLSLALAFTGGIAVAQKGGGGYREKVTEGNFLVLEQNYHHALQNYKEAYAIDSSNANINYKMGFCYLKLPNEKNKALPFLQRAVQDVTRNYDEFEPSIKQAPVLAYYYMGMALHLNYQFDEAISYFEKFRALLNPKKQADLVRDVDYRVAQANNAKVFIAAPLGVTITNLGDSINSPFPEYGPVISADESMMIFTSRRAGSTGGEKTTEDQFYEDIYIAYERPGGGWTKPVSIDPNINTFDHEAAIGLSADGQTLFIYKDENGDGNIYESRLVGEQWSSPVKVGHDNNSDINTSAWEPSACVSADGKTLYFVSDRKGGLGGTDIYRAVRLPNGKWSKAQNLGPRINSEYDEDSPFIHPDQRTLFFSSKGHKNMGGYDIYFSSLSDSGWSVPTNMGYPINTPDDDIFYVTSADGKRSYFSSNRENGLGEKDIYVATLAEPPKVDPVALIVGTLNVGDGKPCPEDNEIIVTNIQTGQVDVYRAKARNCSFSLVLTPGQEYSISYVVNGEEVKSESIAVPAGIVYEEVSKTVDLFEAPIDTTPKKDPVVVNEPKPDPAKIKDLAKRSGTKYEMSFKYNVTEIDVQNEAFTSFIDTIASIVKANGAISLQVTGGASQVPTRKFKSNKELAQSRANKAKEQVSAALQAKGIDMSKVTIKVKGTVGGPVYEGDYHINRKKYEKYQFVKIAISKS